jgi:hypothetical protein
MWTFIVCLFRRHLPPQFVPAGVGVMSLDEYLLQFFANKSAAGIAPIFANGRFSKNLAGAIAGVNAVSESDASPVVTDNPIAETGEPAVVTANDNLAVPSATNALLAPPRLNSTRGRTCKEDCGCLCCNISKAATGIRKADVVISTQEQATKRQRRGDIALKPAASKPPVATKPAVSSHRLPRIPRSPEIKAATSSEASPLYCEALIKTPIFGCASQSMSNWIEDTDDLFAPVIWKVFEDHVVRLNSTIATSKEAGLSEYTTVLGSEYPDEENFLGFSLEQDHGDDFEMDCRSSETSVALTAEAEPPYRAVNSNYQEANIPTPDSHVESVKPCNQSAAVISAMCFTRVNIIDTFNEETNVAMITDYAPFQDSTGVRNMCSPADDTPFQVENEEVVSTPPMGRAHRGDSYTPPFHWAVNKRHRTSWPLRLCPRNLFPELVETGNLDAAVSVLDQPSVVDDNWEATIDSLQRLASYSDYI